MVIDLDQYRLRRMRVPGVIKNGTDGSAALTVVWNPALALAVVTTPNPVNLTVLEGATMTNIDAVLENLYALASQI